MGHADDGQGQPMGQGQPIMSHADDEQGQPIMSKRGRGRGRGRGRHGKLIAAPRAHDEKLPVDWVTEDGGQIQQQHAALYAFLPNKLKFHHFVRSGLLIVCWWVGLEDLQRTCCPTVGNPARRENWCAGQGQTGTLSTLRSSRRASRRVLCAWWTHMLREHAIKWSEWATSLGRACARCKSASKLADGSPRIL
eukprot:525354-Amphidinium_carterae.1